MVATVPNSPMPSTTALSVLTFSTSLFEYSDALIMLELLEY